jgi:P27 family predicted phage terminase small subunit
MGLRGPPPTPTRVLEARGSKIAIYDRRGEAVYPPGAPDRPPWLEGEAAAEWDRQVAALESAGVLSVADGALLAAWCEAWAEFCQVAADLKVAGRLAKNAAGGVVRSPLVLLRDRAVERLLRLAGQFGFSPSARVRVRAMERGADGRGEKKGKSRFFDAG